MLPGSQTAPTAVAADSHSAISGWSTEMEVGEKGGAERVLRGRVPPPPPQARPPGPSKSAEEKSEKPKRPKLKLRFRP
jgi:hypothetical protein